MTAVQTLSVNPELDLILERVVDVSPELVWAAYTTPSLLMQWFCPMMRSPEGEGFPNEGCYLEVVPNRRLVWTDTLLAGFRPASTVTTGADGLVFTAVITLEPEGSGTRYTAHVMHGDAESQKKHEAMGFHGGWSTAFDQLVALMQQN
jgi:uncharacterized protein YndB with AHSA1/START domain